MDRRKRELIDIQNYIGKVDMEVTMILQQLQWDRCHLLEKPLLVSCKYDPSHRVPVEGREAHEAQCFFNTNGYSKKDKLLPDPIDTNLSTLIKLNTNDIKAIIDKAAQADPSFKRGTGSKGAEPMSLERLQVAYTADERRAIHDAVVKAAPSCHDLSDLALLSGDGEEEKNPKQKSRLEILAELRDMKRRRTKYRVAAKTRNYSDLLRDVIKTQMEVYTDVKSDQPKEGQQKQSKEAEMRNRNTNNDKDETSRDRHIRERHNEADRSRDRSRDHKTYGHSRRDFDENSRRAERSDKYQPAQRSSRHGIENIKMEDDDYYRKHRGNKSGDTLDKGYKTDRNSRHENNAKTDFHDNRDKYTRIKKEKIDDEDYRNESHSRDYENSGRESHIDKKRQEKNHKSKHKSEESSHSSYSNKYNANPVYIKQEQEDVDSRYSDSGTSSKRNSYNESKHYGERNKHGHEKTKGERKDRHVREEKYKNEGHSGHKSSDREPKYRRYYD